MAFDKPIIQTSNPFKKEGSTYEITRTIYYAEVTSIDDPLDGGRIQARVQGLDNKLSNEQLPWSYPMLPKFFHVYPQVGEVVRIFIENIKYPERSRYWMGSIISQLQNIGFDSIYTALSTTNYQLTIPDKAITTYPDADGVFPTKSDIGIIGKVNTDIILKDNEVLIRAGKHENNNVFKLNTKNPASINLVFESVSGTTSDYQSENIISADKIAIISHNGVPNFKAARLEAKDRKEIFDNGHPLVRGDALVEVLNVMRNAIIDHIHGYSNLSADKTEIINSLEKIDFNQILQKYIVIN